MSFFGRLLSLDEKNQDETDNEKLEKTNKSNTNSVDELNDEIVAVIAAAIASMESRPDIRLQVKAIRRITQNSPVWNATGRLERLARHLNA